MSAKEISWNKPIREDLTLRGKESGQRGDDPRPHPQQCLGEGMLPLLVSGTDIHRL